MKNCISEWNGQFWLSVFLIFKKFDSLFHAHPATLCADAVFGRS